MHQKLSRSFDRHRFVCVWFCVILFGGVFDAVCAEASTYYVAQTSAASDDNDGTRLRPFRSIARAVEWANPGDLIIVRAGDYRNEDTGWGPGVIPVLAKGEPGKSIRIRGAKGARPLVHTFLLQGAEYVTITGFEFRYCDFSTHPNWQDMPCIVRDVPENPDSPIDYTLDWSQRKALVEPAFATYFSLIERLEYVNAINLEECKNVSITDNVIDGYWAGIQCRHCTKVAIKSNAISHTVNGIFTFEPAPALTQSVIQNNTISHSLDIGISIQKGCNRVQVLGNEVSYSGSNHISVLDSNRYCTVSGNRLFYGGYYSEAMRYPGSSGISIHTSLNGIVVSRNDVSFQIDRTNFDGNGIILDLMQRGSTVAVFDNFLYRNMGSGLNLTISPNALVAQNMFIENGYRTTAYRNGAGIKISRGEDVGNFISDNYFIGNKHAGILSEETLRNQSYVDYNVYFTERRSPILWDSYFRGYKVYRTIEEVNQATGWELHGYVIPSLDENTPSF